VMKFVTRSKSQTATDNDALSPTECLKPAEEIQA
jgi:hypothetical protein